MNKKNLILLICLIIFLFFSSPVFAKVYVNPSLSLSDNYVDNILDSYSDKKPDNVFTFTPSLGINLETKRLKANLDYAFGTEFFKNNSSYNNHTHNASLNGDFRLFKSLVVKFTERFTVRQGSDAIDDFRGLRSSLLSGRRKRTYNSSNVSIVKNFGSFISSELYYNNHLEDVDIETEVDEKQHVLGSRLNYLLTKGMRDSLYLDYRKSFYIFNWNRSLFTFDQDFNTDHVILGYTHKFSKTFEMSLNGGVTYTHYEHKSLEDDFFHNFGGNLSKRFRKFLLTFSYDRNVNSGGGFGGAVLEQQFKSNFETIISPELNLILFNSYSINGFLDSSNRSSRDDNNIFQSEVKISYNINIWLNLKIGYMFRKYNYDSQSTSSFGFIYHRAFFAVEIPVKKWLAVSLDYKYTEKYLLDKNIGSARNFSNKTIMISLTFNPNQLINLNFIL